MNTSVNTQNIILPTKLSGETRLLKNLDSRISRAGDAITDLFVHSDEACYTNPVVAGAVSAVPCGFFHGYRLSERLLNDRRTQLPALTTTTGMLVGLGATANLLGTCSAAMGILTGTPSLVSLGVKTLAGSALASAAGAYLNRYKM